MGGSDSEPRSYIEPRLRVPFHGRDCDAIRSLNLSSFFTLEAVRVPAVTPCSAGQITYAGLMRLDEPAWWRRIGVPCYRSALLQPGMFPVRPNGLSQREPGCPVNDPAPRRHTGPRARPSGLKVRVPFKGAPLSLGSFLSARRGRGREFGQGHAP